MKKIRFVLSTIWFAWASLSASSWVVSDCPKRSSVVACIVKSRYRDEHEFALGIDEIDPNKLSLNSPNDEGKREKKENLVNVSIRSNRREIISIFLKRLDRCWKNAHSPGAIDDLVVRKKEHKVKGTFRKRARRIARFLRKSFSYMPSPYNELTFNICIARNDTPLREDRAAYAEQYSSYDDIISDLGTTDSELRQELLKL